MTPIIGQPTVIKLSLITPALTKHCREGERHPLIDFEKKRFHGVKDVEIWFGGSVLTVQELITLVADEFGVRMALQQVCPRRLRAVLRDLDDILEAACDDTVKNRSETLYKTGEVIKQESRVIVVGDGVKRKFLVTREEKLDTDADVKPLDQVVSNASMQKLIVRDTGNALQALRVIHHKLNKSYYRPPPRQQAPLDANRRLTV